MRIEEAFRGRRVLLTGHTGFKGGWLAIWLDMLGAEVVGVALPPDQPDGIYQASGIGGRIRDIRQDIRDGEALEACFAEHAPEVVLHLAAQALVRESYRTPAATFATNTMGTVNVLEAVRHTPSVKALVVATTDKCYENTGITS
ncbi:MAG TPA: GDP-mannose 4,6-dehydratase, partial [Flavobacteriales bacterium]|nr:GDP-mannose 4,6-dehydratase [Flavobacteriales bacterium]